jgi:hypothetical protein
MMRCLFIAGLLAAGMLQIQAQQVSIYGNAPDYAGCILTFCSNDNYFTNDEAELGKCTVTADGEFSIVLPCKETRLVYLHLGIFNARLFVEPGLSYEVKLPPRTDKSPEETESPFFEEVSVILAVLSVKDSKGNILGSEEELNVLLVRFDEIFNPLYDSVAVDAARGKNIAPAPVIRDLKQKIPHSDNRYYNDYVFYRTGLLHYASMRSGTTYISNVFFAAKPVQHHNEAYMDLFNITYDRYFMYFGRTDEGKAIYETVNRNGSFVETKSLLKEDGVLPSDSLCELVILKNIFDEFYSDRFSRQALLRLLDSMISRTNIEIHREIARQIRSKITRLLRGFEPPGFSLYNQDSVLVDLETCKGKYTYLMFCTTRNYVCLKQYELLEKLYQVHGKWLRIAVVSVDDSFAGMCEFRKNEGYQWDFLHYANSPDILKNYDVRIFPTCFLIDPEGKLVLSPAPAASDNIERVLYKELQDKRLWDEYIRKGWIEDKIRSDSRFNFDLGIPK